MTQTEQVVHHMREYGSITALDAVRFGCFRLAARIHDLRDQGLKIKSEAVSDNGKTFARYSLVMEFQETLF